MSRTMTPRQQTDEEQQRTRLLRKLHAEANKRRVGHELLSANGCAIFGVRSLRELSVRQLREYIQQLCQTPAPQVQRRSPTRPAGKRRPEGVVWLPTFKQRLFIASLLEEYFGDDRDPVACAVRYVRARIGDDQCGTGLKPVSMVDIAGQVQTGRAAGQLIKALIGDLKRAGRWGRRVAPASRR